VHLSGDWGAGKTSILNFLKVELEKEELTSANRADDVSDRFGDSVDTQWKVIQFNAWQNQHTNPPWWALLDKVYQESKGELSWVDRGEEWLWRRSRQRVQKLVAGIIMILLAGGLIWLLLWLSKSSTLSPQLVFGATVVLTTLWAFSVGVSKPLFLHSR